MPSVLALFLCTAFVFFLLRIDHKQSSGLSLALWVPTVWMLIIASKPLGVWFPFTTRVEDVTSSPLDQIFLILLLACGLFLLIRRKLNWSKFFRENSWLIVLLCYMFLSTLWSDMPFVSLKRWIRELIAVVMALLVLSEQNSRRAMQTILRRTTYILIPFSLLLIKYYPVYGVQYGRWSGEIMWIGVTMQKNGLGRLCIISAFFLMWSLWRRMQGRDRPVVKYQTYAELVVLLLTIRLLIGPTLQAYSATSVLAFIVGLMTFGALLWLNKNRISIRSLPVESALLLFIVLGTASVFIGSLSTSHITGALGRDATLTGRTDVWANLLPEAMQRIVLGHGFGGFWTNKTRLNYEISEAHSGYLDVLLDIGFFGLILLAIFLMFSCQKAKKGLYYDFNWSTLWICYLLMAAVHNITETSLNSLSSHLTAVLVFMAVTSSATPALPYEICQKYCDLLQQKIESEA
ncbi:O-antigen ligase family protein [candidate division KSB1 bacterium]|nr:O-antigen ligase family protein [candidate division KSB1 bacterium]RQW01190.1 MAG: O-antigen ligase family protein [candidate division KSB1 bacterium]